MKAVLNSRKASNTAFQLETGISIDSGSGNNTTKQTRRKQSEHDGLMRKHVKDALVFTKGDKPSDVIINSQEFVEEAFKLFREMLSNSSPLKNMSEAIFGEGESIAELVAQGKSFEVIGKILRASINSFIILDKYT